MSEEIAEGGSAYPVGARELARRLAEDLDARPDPGRDRQPHRRLNLSANARG